MLTELQSHCISKYLTARRIKHDCYKANKDTDKPVCWIVVSSPSKINIKPINSNEVAYHVNLNTNIINNWHSIFLSSKLKGKMPFHVAHDTSHLLAEDIINILAEDYLKDIPFVLRIDTIQNSGKHKRVLIKLVNKRTGIQYRVLETSITSIVNNQSTAFLYPMLFKLTDIYKELNK
ncbi:MAG: hypothetical protein CMK07_13590 [Ponticaulis sp.]|nr:hypothetical protein [Ponticaulis sp.]|tara:strand:- start:2436 stop:2966 length:531 start_codon:yes stop_codon:yes gene_type:complete